MRLVEPGQLVKNRAFSDIRVARQRDDPFARAPFDDKAAVDRTFCKKGIVILPQQNCGPYSRHPHNTHTGTSHAFQQSPEA